MAARKTVLLVEDDEADAELAARAFEAATPHAVIVRARDGLQAVDYLFGRGSHAGRDPTDAPALILLDWNLPGAPGLSILTAIRRSLYVKHVPVVVLTSSNDEGDRRAAYAHHANCYLQKPVEYERLAEAMAALGRFWLGFNRPPPPAGA